MVVTSVHLTTVAIAESELGYLRRRIGSQRTDHFKVIGPHATVEECSDLTSRRAILFSQKMVPPSGIFCGKSQYIT
jgi:hypothetical protein